MTRPDGAINPWVPVILVLIAVAAIIVELAK
jgi:hypothetical protein